MEQQVCLKEKVTPDIVIFLSSPIKSLYWVKLTTEVSASKVHAIPRNSSPKFSIGSRHFEQVLNGQAAKRDVIPSKRFLSCQACLYSRSWLIFNLTFFSNNVFLMLRIGKAKTKKLTIGQRAHFGVLVSDVKPYQRKENVCVAEKSQSQKTKNYGRNNFNLILHWSQSMEKQFSL